MWVAPEVGSALDVFETLVVVVVAVVVAAAAVVVLVADSAATAVTMISPVRVYLFVPVPVPAHVVQGSAASLAHLYRAVS